MSLNLYMDHNVHADITQELRDRSMDCVTTFEDGMAADDDTAVLSRAAALGRIVFTQDVDFLTITAEWIASKRPFAGVIYARQMGITIGQAIADLELMARILEPDEMANAVEYLPL